MTSEAQSDTKALETKISKLHQLHDQARLGGGKKRIEQQHARSKHTARERIEMLLDEGTFHELDPFVKPRAEFARGEQSLGDGVVTGWGHVDGRLVYVYAQDFTVVGGTLSWPHAQKICKIMDLAMKNGAPLVGIPDSGGARIQEGVLSLAGYGEVFLRNTLASGVIPQITAIMGPSAGGACYSPAITDFIFMVNESSHMFITGPDVIRAVTHEEVTFEDLGGAMVHNSKSGVAHFASDSEEDCLAMVRQLLSYVPSNNVDDPPRIEPTDDPHRTDEELNYIVPDNPNKPYDIKDVIRRVVDDGEFFEVHAYYAPNIVIGFARLNGRSVGIVANQPAVLAGVLDNDASIKGARFVRFLDCFNIPIITFVDVPGFMPGVNQEHGGIIRNGAKLLFAYCEATVPKITVITRKAYGGAYIVMSSKHIRGDISYAWPGGETAVMGSEGAVNIIHRKEIEDSPDPEATRKRLIEEYREKFSNPYVAAGYGFIDDVIEPKETRPMLIAALEMTKNKRDSNPPKKHGNIPL